MSKVYGPVALTAGVSTFQDINAGAAWIVIENSSLALDLGISFQVNDPGTPPQFSGSNAWAGVVQSGGAKRFAVPANDGLWTGRVWLYPLSVSTLSAATGTTSGYSRAYVTAFDANEQPQDFQGVIRGLDLTSQPRIITIGAPALNWYNSFNLTTPSAVGGAVDISARILLSATNLSNNFVAIYIYSIYLALSAWGSCVLEYQIQFRDAAHVNVGSAFLIWRFVVSSAGSTGPSSPFAAPLLAPICYAKKPLDANAAEYVHQIKLTSGNLSVPFNSTIVQMLDLANAAAISDVGNQTLHQSPGSLY